MYFSGCLPSAEKMLLLFQPNEMGENGRFVEWFATENLKEFDKPNDRPSITNVCLSLDVDRLVAFVLLKVFSLQRADPDFYSSEDKFNR